MLTDKVIIVPGENGLIGKYIISDLRNSGAFGYQC